MGLARGAGGGGVGAGLRVRVGGAGGSDGCRHAAEPSGPDRSGCRVCCSRPGAVSGLAGSQLLWLPGTRGGSKGRVIFPWARLTGTGPGWTAHAACNAEGWGDDGPKTLFPEGKIGGVDRTRTRDLRRDRQKRWALGSMTFRDSSMSWGDTPRHGTTRKDPSRRPQLTHVVHSGRAAAIARANPLPNRRERTRSAAVQ
jgi:hypothetical protein